MAVKGVKSLRGQPELYDEVKQVVSISLTPTGINQLDIRARAFKLSRSEFIERIARGTIPITQSAD